MSLIKRRNPPPKQTLEWHLQRWANTVFARHSGKIAEKGILLTLPLRLSRTFGSHALMLPGGQFVLQLNQRVIASAQSHVPSA